MKMLIRRELNQLYVTFGSKYPVLTYALFVIGVPVIFWTIGPGLFGFLDTEGFYLNVSVVGMVVIMQIVTANMQRETASRQLLFLKTLPVKESSIINAKFISVLVLACMAVIWLNIVALIYSLMNGQHLLAEHGLLLSYFSSLHFFVVAMMLLKYFASGSQNLFVTAIISIFVWGGVFFLAEFVKKEWEVKPGMPDFMTFTGFALIIYALSWKLALQTVKKRGVLQYESQKNHDRSMEGRGL